MKKQTQLLLHLLFVMSLTYLPVSQVFADDVQTETVPITVDPRICRTLSETDGGDAAYVPGIDARGRSVVPAEGPGKTDWGVPGVGELEIDVSVDIAKKYGLSSSDKGMEPMARIGKLRLTDSGTVTLNGVPLADRQTAILKEACRQIKNGKGRALPKGD